MNPGNESLWAGLVGTYAKQGDTEKAASVFAIEKYKIALEEDPTHLSWYICLGEMHKVKGDLDGAIGAFEKATYGDKFAWWRQAGIYKAKGDHNEAIRTFQRAIKKQPTKPLWCKGLARLHQGAGDYEEAITVFKSGVEIDPTNSN
jgi:tetratricopeptide (TPR) repeat protein